MQKVERFVSPLGKQKYLAISLICFLIGDAFIAGNNILLCSIMAMLIVSGPMATAKTRRQLFLTISLAVLMVVLGYASAFAADTRICFTALMVAVFFFATLISLISRALLVEQTRVTAETLWAAVNVYVLFGMMFAFLYSAVLVLEPAAFSGGILEEGQQKVAESMVYYSFVTMTTLGYGDITPEIHAAATLAYVQALIGQLCVAILIARLVSMTTPGGMTRNTSGKTKYGWHWPPGLMGLKRGVIH